MKRGGNWLEPICATTASVALNSQCWCGFSSEIQANSSQMIKMIATQRKSFETNWSCAKSIPFILTGPLRKSPMLNVEAKNPNGKAPIPKDMWKPSPKPKFGNACCWGESGRIKTRMGGYTYRAIIGFRTLALWSGRNFLITRILLATTTTIEWNHLLTWDWILTNRTCWPHWFRFEPLM